MPISYKNVNNLKVAEDLLLFVNNELFEGTDISPEKFWLGFDKISHELDAYIFISSTYIHAIKSHNPSMHMESFH